MYFIVLSGSDGEQTPNPGAHTWEAGVAPLSWPLSSVAFSLSLEDYLRHSQELGAM